jgi:hypothetical protein
MSSRVCAVSSTAFLVAAVGLVAACSNAPHGCINLSRNNPLVSGAASFRLDVYAAGAGCASDSVPLGGSQLLVSHAYGKSDPIVLNVPAGKHTVVLTTFADAQAKTPLGRGCVVADVSAGSQLCVDLTLVAVGDMGPVAVGDMSVGTSIDMSPGASIDMSPGASIDMSPGVVASKCPGSPLILCDGFEGAAFDPRWGTYIISGNVAIDATRAYRGASSLHAHIDPNGARAHATVYTMLTYPQPDVYVRLFAYVPAPVSVSTDFVTVIQKPSPYDSIRLSLENGSFSTYDSTDTQHIVATTPVPVGHWTCVEWRVHFDPAAGYTQLWIDGQSTNVAGNENTQPNPFYYYLRIGLESNTTVAQDLWLDEIAVDAASIGCAK